MFIVFLTKTASWHGPFQELDMAEDFAENAIVDKGGKFQVYKLGELITQS